jgi:hypothetical protein
VPIEAAADVPDASLSAIERLEIGEDRARLRDCLQELTRAGFGASLACCSALSILVPLPVGMAAS